jgi:peptidoglycan/xylan/chitin deacetylase (PgdA/CDA1 family)
MLKNLLYIVSKLKSEKGFWPLAKKILYGGLYWSGAPFLVREIIQQNQVTMILYHNIEPERFDQHVRALKQRYTIIALEDYIKAREDPKCVLPKKALVITFDDGYRGNFDLWPVIQRHNIPVTIFICSGIVGTNRKFWTDIHVPQYSVEELKMFARDERLRILSQAGFEEAKEYPDRSALNKDEIATMRPLVSFQSHTRFHPILPRSSDEKAREEISESKHEIFQKFGLESVIFAYPNGDYSGREIRMLKEAGYKAALTVDPYFNTLTTDPYRLKRICIPDDADIPQMIVNVSGVKIFLRCRLGKLHYGYQ